MAQECLESGRDASEYIDRSLGEGGEFYVDEEFAEAVQVYLDLCRSYMTAGWAFWLEGRVSLADLDPPEEMSGMADFSAYHAETRHLVTVDLKFGKGIGVAVEDNKQVRTYTLGRWLALPPTMPVDRITTIICQPRVLYGEKNKTADIDPTELIEWSLDLLAHARATQEPNAPLVVGKWCRFCPRSGRCEAQAKQAYAAAEIDFDSITEDAPGTVITVPEVRLLTPARMARVLELAPQLEAFVKAVKEAAKSGIESGRLRVPGWKVVAGEGRLKWAAEEEATTATAVVSKFGLVEEQVWTRKLASYAKIRDAIVDGLRINDGMRTKDAKAVAVNLLSDLTTIGTSGMVLVPASDPRPSVSGDKGSEFDIELLDPPPSSSSSLRT
jgi:hypothetical protein